MTDILQGTMLGLSGALGVALLLALTSQIPLILAKMI